MAWGGDEIFVEVKASDGRRWAGLIVVRSIVFSGRALEKRFCGSMTHLKTKNVCCGEGGGVRPPLAGEELVFVCELVCLFIIFVFIYAFIYLFVYSLVMFLFIFYSLFIIYLFFLLYSFVYYYYFFLFWYFSVYLLDLLSYG